MNPKSGVYSLIRRADERPERDADPAERGKDEDQVADVPAESSDGGDQHGPDDAGADEAEQEERTDRRHDEK